MAEEALNPSAPKTPVRVVVDVSIRQGPLSMWGYTPLEFTTEPWKVPGELWTEVEQRVYWCDECMLYHPRPGYCIKTLQRVVEIQMRPQVDEYWRRHELGRANIPLFAPYDGWLQGEKPSGPYRGSKVW